MSTHILLAGSGSQDQHTGLIHLLGSGIKAMGVGPFGATPPFVLGVYVEATPEQCDRDVELAVVLLDLDGSDVAITAGPNGEKSKVRIAQQVRIETPDGPGGMPGSMMMLVEFSGGLPMTPGTYRFRVLLDGEPIPGSDTRFAVLNDPNAPPAAPPAAERVSGNGQAPASGRGPAWVPGTPLNL